MSAQAELLSRNIIETTRLEAGRLTSLIPVDVGMTGRYRVRCLGYEPDNLLRFWAVIRTIGVVDRSEDPEVLLVPPRSVDCLNALNVKFELAKFGDNSREGR